MDDHPALPWLLLQQLPSLTTARTHQLLQHFIHPRNLLGADSQALTCLPQALQHDIQALQQQGEHHACYRQALAQLEQAGQQQVSLVALDDPCYPPLLKQIHLPPPLLYVKGDVLALSDHQLAVIGARKATAAALRLTADWSKALAAAGLTITSGLALGIDGHAHQGALAGGGHTVAVLAHGMDQLYPRQHRQLAADIASHGALVSEFPFGTAPRREHFPQRNRIISGLSLGVLVVEAALKSGSLITARYALDQGREVFAVPGAVNNVMARGCHQLIRQGALLVENADDILQALALPLAFACENPAMAEPQAISEHQQRLLAAMDFAPTHIEQLIETTGLDAATLASELTLLELDGLVVNVAGRYQRLA